MSVGARQYQTMFVNSDNTLTMVFRGSRPNIDHAFDGDGVVRRIEILEIDNTLHKQLKQRGVAADATIIKVSGINYMSLIRHRMRIRDRLVALPPMSGKLATA